MKPYVLEKYYFDVLTPENDYLYLYLAWVRIFGHRETRLRFFGAPSDAGGALVRSFHVRMKPKYPQPAESSDERSIEFDGGGISITGSHCRVGLMIDDLSINLDYRTHQAAEPAGSVLAIERGAKRILWSPVHLHSSVRGSITCGKRSFSFGGCSGYVDYLYSDIFPWLVPVDTLYWGRVHAESLALSYTLAQGPGAQWWPVMLVRAGDASNRIENVTLGGFEAGKADSTGGSFPSAYLIEGRGADMKIRVHVTHQRVAEEADFLGASVSESRWKHGIVKRLARTPWGMKYLSRCQTSLTLGSGERSWDSLPCVTEIVRFK